MEETLTYPWVDGVGEVIGKDPVALNAKVNCDDFSVPLTYQDYVSFDQENVYSYLSFSLVDGEVNDLVNSYDLPIFEVVISLGMTEDYSNDFVSGFVET